MQDHERQLRGYYTAIDEARIEDALLVFDPAVVYRREGCDPLNGLDAVRAFYRTERTQGGEHRIRAVVDAGDLVLVDGRFLASNCDAVRFVDAFQFHDGRVIRRITYPIG